MFGYAKEWLRRRLRDGLRLSELETRLNTLAGFPAEKLDAVLRAAEELKSLRPQPYSVSVVSEPPQGTVRGVPHAEEGPYQILNRSGLFVVGNARSGTTILMDILNSSPEVFLFSEYNLHILRRFPATDFGYGPSNRLEAFVARRLDQFPLYEKCSQIQPWLLELNDESMLWNHLSRHFPYVGDKIAMGAADYGGYSEPQLALELFKNIPFASAFLPLRSPIDAAASMRRKFSEIPSSRIVESVRDSLRCVLELYALMGRSVLVFHEDLQPAIIDEIAEHLQTKLTVSPDLVSKEFVTPWKDDPELKRMFPEWRALQELEEIYERIRERMQIDNKLLKTTRRREWIREWLDLIDDVLIPEVRATG